MPTPTTISVALCAALAMAVGGWTYLAPGNAVPPGHNPQHVNCPPGSHGKPRYSGVGENLDRARQDARAARSLESRALTAQ